MRRKYKVAAKDYSENMLPRTHKEVFFDVMKLHWFDLIKLGLLLLAFFLPSVLLTVAGDIFESQMLQRIENAAQEDARQMRMDIASFRAACSVWRIPLYMLFSVAFSGVIRIVRKFAHEEIPFFWQDIRKGIRQNCGQMMLLALIIGIQQAIGSYLWNIGISTQSNTLQLTAVAYYAIFAVAFLPIWAYMVVFIALYSNSFVQNFRLAVAVYAKNLLKTIFTLAAICVVEIIACIPLFICHLVGNIAGAILMPISMLMWTLFVFEVLDREIHPRFFPELVGKGLYKKTKPEDNKTI